MFVIVVADIASFYHGFSRFPFHTALAEQNGELVILSERSHWMIQLVGWQHSTLGNTKVARDVSVTWLKDDLRVAQGIFAVLFAYG